MSQFDHESVKGTDLSDEEELEDETLQDVESGEGAVTVGDTVAEVTTPDTTEEEPPSAPTE